VLKITGSWRAGKREETEPTAPSAAPVRPEWLDDVATQCWDQLLPQLDELGVLSSTDGNAIARYCQAWSDWRKCCDFIAKRGMVYTLKGDDGKAKCLQQFPHVSIRNKLQLELTRLEQEFGLTPSARSRIQVSPSSRRRNPDDDLDAFIERRA
jgi:P27 family predicted phage terminase small subunit